MLTLTASSNASLGAATITVNGTSGTLSHSATLNLTIGAPPPVNGGVTVTPVVVAERAAVAA